MVELRLKWVFRHGCLRFVWVALEQVRHVLESEGERVLTQPVGAGQFGHVGVHQECRGYRDWGAHGGGPELSQHAERELDDQMEIDCFGLPDEFRPNRPNHRNEIGKSVGHENQSLAEIVRACSMMTAISQEIRRWHGGTIDEFGSAKRNAGGTTHRQHR